MYKNFWDYMFLMARMMVLPKNLTDYYHCFRVGLKNLNTRGCFCRSYVVI